jgi:hypothetical protein
MKDILLETEDYTSITVSPLYSISAGGRNDGNDNDRNDE